MVKKSTIAILAGLAVVAAVVAGSANRRTKIIPRAEPIPFAVPEPVPQPVPLLVEIPLTVKEATERLKQEFGNIYRPVKVFRERQITLGAERYKMIKEGPFTEFKPI
jgi:hypothetical protein